MKFRIILLASLLVFYFVMGCYYLFISRDTHLAFILLALDVWGALILGFILGVGFGKWMQDQGGES